MLDEILQRPIIGSYLEDKHIFDDIDSYIKNEGNPLESRIKALAHIHMLMGCEDTKPYPTKESLNDYLKGMDSIEYKHVFLMKKFKFSS